MTLEVLNYLKEYIKNKYPMYYDPDNNTEFMKFINIISSDKKFRSELSLKSVNSSEKEVLSNGEVDLVIDELVSTYGQIRYTKIWANIGSLSSYIKDAVIKDNQKKSVDNSVHKDTVDVICKEIALNIIRNEENEDYSYYMDGAFDQKFIEDYNYYLSEYKKNITSRVDTLILEKLSRSKFKVTDDTYILMLDNICDVLMRDFNYKGLVSGIYDKNILMAFNFFKKNLIDEVSNYVRNYINNEIDDLLRVSVDDVVNYMVLVTVFKGEFSAEKLVSGKLDNIIKSSVEMNRKEKPSTKDAIGHINSIVISNEPYVMSNEESLEISYELYEKLRSMNIFDNEIVEKKYDSEILKLFESLMREKLSVRDGKTSDKKKANWAKRVINKRILPLVLAGTVTVAAGKFAYDGISYLVQGGKNIVQNIKNQKPLRKVDEFDNYNYEPIFTKYTDGYKTMKLNAVDFYQRASVYENSNYKYLGFYRAYDYVMDDRLAIMDSMIKDLKLYSANRDDLSDFYNSISDCSCYLDFVVARLDEMGFDEIKDEKYVRAVRIYKNIMSAGNMDLTTMDIMSVDFPEEAKVIVEIMDKYKEYSEEYLIDFGNTLLETPVDKKNKGRGN